MEGAVPVWCRGVFLLFGAACTNRATDLHQGSCSHLQSKCREWSGSCGGALGEEGLLKGMSVILPLPTLIIPLSGVSPNALGTPGSWDCSPGRRHGGAVMPTVCVLTWFSPLSWGSAECPLTAAAQLELGAEMIKALRNGGAHLDFRTREGMTALHKAVRCRNHAALVVSCGLVPSARCPSASCSTSRPGLMSLPPYQCALLGSKNLSCAAFGEHSLLQKCGTNDLSRGEGRGEHHLLPWPQHPSPHRVGCPVWLPGAAGQWRRFSCRRCWTWVPPQTTRTAEG